MSVGCFLVVQGDAREKSGLKRDFHTTNTFGVNCVVVSVCKIWRQAVEENETVQDPQLDDLSCWQCKRTS